MTPWGMRRQAIDCMCPLDAARHTVEDYDGGAPAMAQRLGKSPETLRKELAPPSESTAKLGLLDAIKIMKRARDLRIADAMEAELGRFALPMPALPDQLPNVEITRHLAHVSKEFADVLQEAAVRCADGKVSETDIKVIEEQWGQLVAAGASLLKHLVQVNQAGSRRVPQA